MFCKEYGTSKIYKSEKKKNLNKRLKPCGDGISPPKKNKERKNYREGMTPQYNTPILLRIAVTTSFNIFVIGGNSNNIV